MTTRKIFLIPIQLMLMLAVNQTAWTQDTTLANAADLISRANLAASQVVTAARNDASLSADEAKAKPFWEGIRIVVENLETTRSTLEVRNERFFTAMANSVAGYAQAQIALLMNESSDQNVAIGMEALGGILETLYENYSKEAARLRQGGELTPAEEEQLDKLIAQQDELMRKLDEVEKNVAKNNEAIRKGINDIRENSRRIRNSRRTVAGFSGGLFAAHFMHNWLWGWHWWWGPWGGWCPGYIDISIIIWDDWVDLVPYDWDFVDTFVDVDHLDLDAITMDDALVADSLDYLEATDFSLDDGDLELLTSDLDLGWDDVTTDTGAEIMEAYESNFDSLQIYEPEIPIETFQDYGIDDFGGGFDDFGDFDFGGFDLGGFDIGGFDF